MRAPANKWLMASQRQSLTSNWTFAISQRKRERMAKNSSLWRSCSIIRWSVPRSRWSRKLIWSADLTLCRHQQQTIHSTLMASTFDSMFQSQIKLIQFMSSPSPISTILTVRAWLLTVKANSPRSTYWVPVQRCWMMLEIGYLTVGYLYLAILLLSTHGKSIPCGLTAWNTESATPFRFQRHSVQTQTHSLHHQN